MKLKLSIIITLIFLSSCFDIFEPNFENVEDSKLRVIGSVLEDPNVQPGDTVTLKVIFAGNDVVEISDWKILYGFMFKMDGEERIRRTDYENLNILNYTSWLPDSIEVILEIDSNIIVMQSEHAFPTKEYALSMDSLVKQYELKGEDLFNNFTEEEVDSIKNNILSTTLNGNILFTAKSENGSVIEIKKTVPITYRKKFDDFIEPSINPDVKWIAIYSVPADKEKMFYPLDDQTEQIAVKNYLYNSLYPDSVNENIIVKNGWSYFLVADPESNFTQELDGDMRVNWFLKNADNTDDEQDSLFVLDYDYMDDNGIFYSNWYVKIKPPVNKSMQNFNVWAYSRCSINYISGYDIKYGHGKFIYN